MEFFGREKRFKGPFFLGIIGALGSSHLSVLKSEGSNRRNPNSSFNQHMKGFDSCVPYSGLTAMETQFDKDSLEKFTAKTDNKVKQSREFAAEVASGYTEILTVMLGNDYKSFLTDHLGSMLFLQGSSIKHWKKLSPKQKMAYDIYIEKRWTKSARVHLEQQFGKYLEILKPILAKSKIRVLHHCSVLERINPKIDNLDFYFAILNSVLQHYITKWDKNGVFTNRNGETIRCKFVDVRSQFFGTENPESLFCKDDLDDMPNVELTHRNFTAMKELAKMWRDAVV